MDEVSPSFLSIFLNPFSMTIIKRLDLKLGFSCNNNCLSCPQAHNKHLGDMSIKQIRENLALGIKHGANEVVLTGGEPTVRRDISDIVSYANEIGYSHIQLQTNGRMLSYKSFVNKLISAGVTEFSPAIHGHTPEIHDYITGSRGAFNQVVMGIRNLKELDQRVIANSVISKLNYKHLSELAQLFIDLKVDQFQLAFIHPVGNAWKNFDLLVPRKSHVMESVHEAIDLAVAKNTNVMVEAYPFCFMKGYERYCSELYMPPSEIINEKTVTTNFDKIRKTQGKVKPPQCKKCRFDLICEGPWKEYTAKYGYEEFKPIPGKKVKDSNQIFDHES